MRRFLLGQLDEAGQEKIELLLLTDRAFIEEFDTVVDELTDQYVRDELNDDERARVEKFFLNTPERQQKLEFATELLSRADAQRDERVEESSVRRPIVEPAAPSWFEQILAFLKQSSFARPLTAAAVVLVVGLILFPLVSNFYPTHNMAVELAASTAKRDEGATPIRVKMPWRSAGLDITLKLPEQARGAQAYRVELLGSEGKQNLTVNGQTDQAIKVTVPAKMLSTGSYALNVFFKMTADSIEDRVRGSYYLDVE